MTAAAGAAAMLMAAKKPPSLALAQQSCLSGSRVRPSVHSLCRGVEKLRAAPLRHEKRLANLAVNSSGRRAATIVAKAVSSGETETAEPKRFRLDNIAPAEGSRKKKTRKGRGIAAGQGATCGFGMRGQKARSGRGTRPGFEGGQNPLYRRIPKLKGVAGGNKKGTKKYTVINIEDLNVFEPNAEVTIDSIQEVGILKSLSKAEKSLPLKILGNGDLTVPLTIKAEAVSSSAKDKVEAAGGSIVLIPMKEKWTRAMHKAKLLAAQETSEEGESKA